MEREVAPKLEVEDADDLGISTGFDDFDHLSVAAEASASARKRFFLVCDATSSMGPWWDMAQASLKKAVDEVASRTNTPFQVKVVAYRDHTCDRVPVQESDWSNDTEYLKDYIKHISCNGGGDYPESVGRGLAPAAQSDACMVILIGDAPGRRESDGLYEAKILGSQKCPVFALHCTDEKRLVENFRAIAKLSGGKAMLLRDAKNMTDIFSALLAKVVFQITYQATSIEGKKLMEGA
jgi:hypothetical protein